MHVDIHSSAEADLEALWEKDPDAAAEVVIVLEELEARPLLLLKLGQHGDADTGDHLLNVKRWEKSKKVSAPIWRFRILNTPATSYRVVYANHVQTRQICVLAVAHKEDFDYELDSDLGKRILSDWRNL